jgi:hypothetical protein
MPVRATWVMVAALASVAMVGCPGTEAPKASPPATQNKQARPDGVVGYYINDDPAAYGAKDIKLVPPGQVMHLGIEDGRWMMRNMLTGYGGTWVETKGVATLTVMMGPTGKTSGKEMFSATRTDVGVTLSLGGMNPPMRFTYVGPSAPKGFGYDEVLGPKK